PRVAPPTAEFESKPAAKADAGPATAMPGFVPDPQRSRNIGLKPPSSASGLGIRQPEPVERGQTRSKEAAADRFEAPAAAPPDLLAKRRDATANAIEQRAASPAPAPSQAAKSN